MNSESSMKIPTDDLKAAFRHSRIYAQGWNAARVVTLKGGPPGNPYLSEPERSRWNEGFAQALAKS
jgi:hypothetical protein